MNVIDLSQDDPTRRHDVISLLEEDDHNTEDSSSQPRHCVTTTPHQQHYATAGGTKRRRRAQCNADIEEIWDDQVVLGPELQVLEVFPDVDVDELRIILQQFQNNVPQVLSFMAEKPYKKSEKTAERHKSELNLHMKKEKEETSWAYNFMSTESFDPTKEYVQQATDLLLSDFRFLSRSGAQGVLLQFKYHYALSHDKVWNAVKGTGDEDVQFDRIMASLEGRGKNVPSDLKRKLQQISRRGAATLQHPRKLSCKAHVTNPILLEEARFVQGKVHEWMAAQHSRRDRVERQNIAQAQGAALECGCCFDSYPFEDMVACRDEGHLFCVDCLKLYAENQIFGQGNLGIDKRTKAPAVELLCCYGGEKSCSSGFHRTCLEKALPPKTLKKYYEVQFTVSIQQAGLSTVCRCPKCGFQADVPETQKIFECPVAECGYLSCRECGEAAHIPLRCDEVEKEFQTKGRLTVEEAISDAVIRKCPKCKQSIIKSDGCNKMRCSCGAFMCYICQVEIQNYSHFCQTPHCTHQPNCGKCMLYSNAAEDDVRAMREAGYAAVERIKKGNATDNPSKKGAIELDVDVEGILSAK